MEQLNQQDYHVETDCLIPSLSQDKSPKGPLQSAIAESVQPNKKMILQDKSLTCETTSQTPISYKTLDLGSISKEKGLCPYWTDCSKEIASHLSWLTEIGSAGLDSKLLTIWSNTTVEKSWFSTRLIQAHNQNWFKTFCQSYMSSHAESTDCGDTITISKRIRLLPTRQQYKKLKQWIGAYRYVYNLALDYAQKQPKTPSWYKTKTQLLNNLPPWANSIPYQIKSLAIKEAFQNLKQQKTKAFKNKTKFRMHFKSKKALRQSCYIPKSAVLPRGLYPRLLGNLKYTESLPVHIKDSRLVLAYDKFYISIPTTKRRSITENQGRIVALDPGIRKFITFVSHNHAGFLAKHDIGKIYRLCFYLDKLCSKIIKIKSKQKQYQHKKAANRIREKIYNLISELHNKIAYFLVNNFDLILLPSFETQNMVSKKSKRKIRSKSARALMTFSHYKFKQKLKQKAFEFGKQVVKVNEAYTSKTNNFTGEIDNNLGGREFIKINNKKMDRDINGALGILLRALGDSPCLETSSVVSEY